MGERIKVDNGPGILELEEVVVGSQVAIACFIEEELDPVEEPGVYSPMVFTDRELACDVKANVKTDVATTIAFECNPRELEPGWVDLFLSGAQTTDMEERDYEASLKVWPTGQPNNGDTLLVIRFPVKYRATR